MYDKVSHRVVDSSKKLFCLVRYGKVDGVHVCLQLRTGGAKYIKNKRCRTEGTSFSPAIIAGATTVPLLLLHDPPVSKNSPVSISYAATWLVLLSSRTMSSHVVSPWL